MRSPSAESRDDTSRPAEGKRGSRSPSPTTGAADKREQQAGDESDVSMRSTRSRSPDRVKAEQQADGEGRSRSRGRSVRSAQSQSRSRSRSWDSRSLSGSRSRSVRSHSSGRSSRSGTPPPARVRKPTKIVVEKLSRNVTSDHIEEIFRPYGDILRVDVPTNKQFMFNRGVAYITYSSPSEAEDAISHMHDGQIDGANISVSISYPRRRFSRSPPPLGRRKGGRAGDSRRQAAPPTSRRGRGHGPRRGRSVSPSRSRSYSGSSRSRSRSRGRDYSDWSRSRSRSRTPRSLSPRPARGGGRTAGGCGRNYSPSRSPRRDGSPARRERSYSRSVTP